MSAALGEAIGGLIVGGIDALRRMSESAEKAEREEAERQLARAREAIEALPVRTGTGGTWDADTESRMRGSAPTPDAFPRLPITTPIDPDRPSLPPLRTSFAHSTEEPPPQPFDGPEDA